MGLIFRWDLKPLSDVAFDRFLRAMPDLVFVAAVGDVDGDVFLDDVLTLQRWGAAPSLHG